MASEGIRLRLTIRRHALPEVKLVWPCADTNELTVANLLSQINEVVTLESGQWGLEDYAVELADSSGASFECLHFQQVRQVFKQDDQVLIRSLLTEDLRRRRISGRHQISGDGIHLVDGIPFGRRRGPSDRPVLSLPPRKRARIDYSESEDDDRQEDEEPAGRLLLEDTSQNLATSKADPLALMYRSDYDEEEDDDDDYTPAVDIVNNDDLQLVRTQDVEEATTDDNDDLEEDEMVDTDDIEEEIRQLQADNNIVDDDSCIEEDSTEAPINTVQDDLHADPETNVVASAGVAALEAAFPLISPQSIEERMKQNQMDIRRTYDSLRKDNDASLTFDGVLGLFLEDRFGTVPDAEPPMLLPGSSSKPTRPLIQEVEEEDEVAKVTHSDLLRALATLPNQASEEDSSDSDSDSNSGEDSSDDSDSESEDPSSRQVTQPHQSEPRQPDPRGIYDDSSSSDESSSSSSDSGDNPRVSHGGAKIQEADQHTTDASSDSSDEDSSDSSSDDDSSSSDGSDSSSEPDEGPSKPITSTTTAAAEPTVSEKGQNSTSDTPTVGRGQGLSRTQKRNARRKAARQYKALQAQSLQPSTAPNVSLEEDLLARKQALLNAVTDSPENFRPEKPSEPMIVDVTNDIDAGNTAPEPEPEAEADEQTNTPHPEGDQAQDANPSEQGSIQGSGSSRRMRLDMGAGRRILFGALGLKNPKTKQDEEKLKADLMKNVKPLKNHRQQEDSEPSLVVEQTEIDGEDEDWRDKINYRAVECCYDNMVLSEPPFPFVQRWDPQQQYGSMRKRKRQSQEYAYDDYYEDDPSWYDYTADDSNYQTKSSKKRKSKGNRQEGAHHAQDDNMELNYDDPVSQKFGDASQMTDLDDLPSVPADFTSLPSLEPGEVKAGMVVAWKQLSLSKASNWQPEIITVTGMVLSMGDDNVLHVVLAKRDREADERLYDEETGKRIYDKFEVPDDSGSEDEQEDDGRRDLPWGDLMDPRLVQAEPSPSTLNSPAREGSAPAAGGAEGESQHQGPVTEQDKSHLTTNDVDSLQLREGTQENLSNPDANQGTENTDSPSIPPGQTHAHFFLHAPSLGGPSMSSAGQTGSAVGGSTTSRTEGVASRPESQDVVIKDSQNSERLGKNSDGVLSKESSVVNGTAAGNEDEAMDEAPEARPEELGDDALVVNNSTDGADGDGEAENTPRVEYPRLPDQSPANSNGSGRQPQQEHDLAASPEDNTTIPDTNLSAHESVPGEISDQPHGAAHGNSSPFPSLEEIWHTAKTSRQSKSPLKSAQLSALGKKSTKNKEYEEAMQRLDEGEESDVSQDQNNTIRSLFPNATQPAPVSGSPDAPGSGGSVRRSTRLNGPRAASFQVPSGSQVVTLSSDSESEDTDDSADDKVVELNADKSSPLPQGSGWVQKKIKQEAGAAKQAGRGRRKSLPNAPTRNSPRSKPKSRPPPSSTSAVNQRGGGKKTRKRL